MKADQLNFNGQRFKPSEWPLGTLSQMDAKVITALFDVRNNVPPTHAIYPSPLYGAHVRNDDTGSRHSIVNGTRLSDATDFFCRKAHLPRIFMEIMKHPRINGCGFYLGSTFQGNSEDWMLVHIDTRPHYEKSFWAAEKINNNYVYHSLLRNPQKYFQILEEIAQ